MATRRRKNLTARGQRRQDGDRVCGNTPAATRQRNQHDPVTSVGKSGRTRLRGHDWDRVLVADDENIAQRDTRTLATRV